MAKKAEKSLVVGLDIGTSKIVAIVGELQTDGSVEVIGLGSHPSRGLRRGVVVDMTSTEQAIQRAVEEAELMAGCEIHSVFAGISGNHLRSMNSDGTVAIKDREVSEGDVERVLEAARAVPVAADQKILHVLPQDAQRVVLMGQLTGFSRFPDLDHRAKDADLASGRNPQKTVPSPALAPLDAFKQKDRTFTPINFFHQRHRRFGIRQNFEHHRYDIVAFR